MNPSAVLSHHQLVWIPPAYRNLGSRDVLTFFPASKHNSQQANIAVYIPKMHAELAAWMFMGNKDIVAQ